MNLASLIKKFFGSQKTPCIQLRYAETADVPFMFELSLIQATRGHFAQSVLDGPAQACLVDQFDCAVNDAPVKMPGDRNGAGARVFVLIHDGTPIGFSMVLEDKPGSWNDRVELFLVALNDQYKGRGLGKRMIEQVVGSIPSKVIYARCFAPSTHMKEHLESLGFKSVHTTAMGMTKLERRTHPLTLG